MSLARKLWNEAEAGARRQAQAVLDGKRESILPREYHQEVATPIHTWMVVVLHRIDNREEKGVLTGTRREAMQFAENVLGMKRWDLVTYTIID